MIDVIKPARDALEFPIGPPETEKLLSCNLLWQVTCRHMQMIFAYVFHNSTHQPDQGAARKGKR